MSDDTVSDTNVILDVEDLYTHFPITAGFFRKQLSLIHI